MVRKFVIGLVALASAAAGLVNGRATGTPVVSVRAAGPTGCASLPAFAGREAPKLATGRSSWAVAGESLVSAGGDARSVPALGVGAGDSIRHIATEQGVGAAYVIDRLGADALVVMTPDGTRRLSERTEVTHPAWSPSGDLAWATGSGVAVLDHSTGKIRRFQGPRNSGTVFSPVFLSASRLAVVVTVQPSDEVPEGERLSNLWVSHLGRPGWRRLTTFRTSGDRWVSIRTPLMFDGAVSFVRLVGRASSTREPRFELWRYEHGAPRLVRRLPDERYLADDVGGRLVWNIPDPANGRSLLVVDGEDGPRTIGCGSVMVDPLDAVDPDRRAGLGEHVPPRGNWPQLEAPAAARAEEIAVIVGDYATSGEADGVVASIRAAYPGSLVEVAESSTSPLAIRPGVYGALLHLPADADPTVALASFRDRLPEYSANSWIVTP